MRCLSGIVLLMALSAGSVNGAELRQLTLAEALREGLEHNHQIRAAGFEAQAAQSAASAASRHYLPSLTVEETWSRSNLPVNTFMMKLNQGRFDPADMNNLNNPAPVTDFRSAVLVEQPLLRPSAWAAQRGAARSAERQQAIAELTREQVAFLIFERYLEVHKSKAHLQSAVKAVEEARESRRQAAARTGAGLGLKSDELRADTHLAAMEQQQISAENNLILARMQLALAAGGQPGEQLDVHGPAQLAPVVQSPELLLQQALRQRQDLKAAERGKEQADAGVLQARSGFLPTVGAFGSWQMNDHATPLGREHDAWATGVTLRWNLFDGFRTKAASDQAVAGRSAANEMLVQTRKQVGYQVHEALLRRQEAEKRLTVARSAVAAADEATRLLGKRFDNALATMLELLDAQSALNQARAALVDNEVNLLLANGRVLHAAGIFLKEVQQ